MSAEEKPEISYHPDALNDTLGTPEIDPVAERKLLRKIDLHLIPVVWTMFLFSNLDRSNIGNAYSGGMREDLKMTSTQYSIALLVFFIGLSFFNTSDSV